METIHVYIGTEPKTEIPRKVLEYSIIETTRSPVEFHPMIGDNWSKVNSKTPGTGFSLLRWSIPERANYIGKAIYLDADQLVLDDIEDLWNSPTLFPAETESCSIWCTFQKSKDYPAKPYKPNTSVMLIDCEKAKKEWPSLEELKTYLKDDVKRKKYAPVMHALHILTKPTEIPYYWNHLNKCKGGVTRLIHYTTEHKQPWYDPTHPCTRTWRDAFMRALKAGYIDVKDVKAAVGMFRKHTTKERGQGMHPYWQNVITQ